MNDHTLHFWPKVSLRFPGYTVMPSSFVWHPRKYRDAVDRKLVLLLEVNVDFNTDVHVGEKKEKKPSSGKPSDLKWGRNEQHVEKVPRPGGIGLFEVVYLGGNIDNESVFGGFLFKEIEKNHKEISLHKWSLTPHSGGSLPLSRENDRLARSGLSWRTGVPASRGFLAFSDLFLLPYRVSYFEVWFS